jgi:hypothetical protein
MKADAARLGAIKVEGLDCFLDVRAQFIPGITLSENALTETLGAIPTIGLPRHLKDNFVHTSNLCHFEALCNLHR